MLAIDVFRIPTGENGPAGNDQVFSTTRCRSRGPTALPKRYPTLPRPDQKSDILDKPADTHLHEWSTQSLVHAHLHAVALKGDKHAHAQ